MSYAIIRNTKYKRENLKGIFRHNERRNRNYSNNNIDKEKQITALQNTENFEVNVPNAELNTFKQESKQKVQTNYKGTAITVADDVKTIYYYDIANNKKYISFSVPSITENGDIAYETVNYEI